MYHAIILEDFLDLINLFGAYDVVSQNIAPNVSRTLRANIQVMLAWMQTMLHPDGQLSFFNDAAFGIAPLYSELEAYALRLECELIKPLKNEITFLKNSGYVRAQNKEAVLLLDVGKIGCDYLPGHAHADTMSCELSIAGQRVLVNSGTSTYDPGLERDFQRKHIRTQHSYNK